MMAILICFFESLREMIYSRDIDDYGAHRALENAATCLANVNGEHLVARSERRERDETYRLRAAAVQDHVIFMSDSHGAILSRSAAAQRSGGYSVEEISRQTFCPKVSPSIDGFRLEVVDLPHESNV
jgi:PAS domain-containing protein